MSEKAMRLLDIHFANVEFLLVYELPVLWLCKLSGNF
jgi:hypothetical protein